MGSKIDPYRILFPIGLAYGFWGPSLWVYYGLNHGAAYPGLRHANIMMGAFLFSFAAGFLMTAVPRFTGTRHASLFEIITASLVFVLMGPALSMNDPIPFHGLLTFNFLLILTFAGSRWRARQYNPPPSFLFVGLGLFMGLSGVGLMLLNDLKGFPGNVNVLAHILFFQGFMLSLVMGVGGKLIPALTGMAGPTLIQIGEKPASLVSRPLLLSAAIFLASFFIEAFLNQRTGLVTRAGILSYFAWKYWRVHRWPPMRSYLANGVWFSAWFMIVGLWSCALFPSYSIHLIHFLYIGGFGLLVMMIATRLTLAHGNFGLEGETSSKSLLTGGILIVLASLTRVLAPFVPKVYVSHLLYAALCWDLGFLVWSFSLVPKLLGTERHSPSTT